VALVSDAGTPHVADPGYHLVRGALAAGVAVVPIPGPSAVTTLVSVAGFRAERFVFEGFLPTRAGARTARLAALAWEPRAIVFFEAARRLGAFLAAAVDALGADREAVVARELTKRHEELLRGTLGDLQRRLAGRDVRGEVTVLVAGAAGEKPSLGVELDDQIRGARAAGQGIRQLSEDIARRTGLPKREVYRRALALERR